MTIQAYILFKVNSGMEKEVSKQLSELDAVQVVSITYGEYDVIAKVIVDDLPKLEDSLCENKKSPKRCVVVHHDHSTGIQRQKATRSEIA